MQEPVLTRGLTRFQPLAGNGEPTAVQSRATDETGYVQPTSLAELLTSPRRELFLS